MKKTFCDSCGEEIVTRPNKVQLEARENLDGAVWGTWEVCDKCFKDIYKKTSFARQFDPNTVEGALRQLSQRAASLDKGKKDEWSPEDYRLKK